MPKCRSTNPTHLARSTRSAYAATCLTVLSVVLAGCGGSAPPSESKSKQSSTLTIKWRDKILFDVAALSGVINQNLSEINCQSPLINGYTLNLFDESGKAVSASVTVESDSGTSQGGKCAYEKDITVDRAARYRAQRTAGGYQMLHAKGSTVDYPFIDASTLEANGWTWSNNG